MEDGWKRESPSFPPCTARRYETRAPGKRGCFDRGQPHATLSGALSTPSCASYRLDATKSVSSRAREPVRDVSSSCSRSAPQRDCSAAHGVSGL